MPLFRTTKTNKSEDETLRNRLEYFTTRHSAHHRPLALVTSGGTAADLEVNAVRCLDNFSTGLRGAVSVEQFLKRGYAVIHLQREGSASPFGRILADALSEKSGKGKSVAHHGPTFEWIGELFDCGDNGLNERVSNDDESPPVDGKSGRDRNKLSKNMNGQNSADPWLYSTVVDANASDAGTYTTTRTRNQRFASLNPRIVHSHRIQSAIRERNRIVQQGLLLTINFRTVDEYLSKLQICSEAINTCGTLGLVYLAAAVSDFYIPEAKRQLHKIQSRDYGLQSASSSSMSASSFGGEEEKQNPAEMKSSQLNVSNTLTLTLFPVPKRIPILRTKWCPMAFVTSFKLETDPSILRQKSVIAMETNNVHLVIGNELATRHEKVYVLSRKSGLDINGVEDDFSSSNNGDSYCPAELPDDYQVSIIKSARGYASNGNSANSIDVLENDTIECVVRHHFHYISSHFGEDSGTMESIAHMKQSSPAAHASMVVGEAASRHNALLEESNRQLRHEKLKTRVKELAWNVAGAAIGMAISYGFTRIMQRQSAGGTYR